ncbi:MAG: hypothetical protein KY395_07050 [Actinobacteria bacterium]|nr:hypothetical protein [Actinomycetota bacterium]
MRIRRALAAVAIAILAVIGITAGPAAGLRDPFVVCVTEPCPPQWP